jgi:hypothetical protein
MKARKAIKRLQRVVTLLGTVIDQYDSGTKEVTGLLDTARSSAKSAADALAASPVRTPTANAGQSGKRTLLNATRKRRAAPKRAAVTSQAKPLRKTPVSRSAAAD